MADIRIPDIPGAHEVSSWFGRWPSFHDAEVLDLQLTRTGTSRLSIHVWNIVDRPSDVDAEGLFKTDEHAVVTFQLAGISDLELFDFSPQNVLGGLEVKRDGETVHVVLHPLYGMGGRIDASHVAVSLTPGEPPMR